MRATPLPAPMPVQVLGVDDGSQHKGHTYGTILVDLERHIPIDLLPDRTAATLAAWLAAHPEIETLSRDRGGASADGARHGAPQARQIADRWHLLASLSSAAEEVLGRQRSALVHAARAATADDSAPSPCVAPLPTPTSTDPSAAPQRAHRLTVYDAVRALHAEGATLTSIAAQMHLDRTTVRRYMRGGLPVRPTPLAPTCPSALHPYVAYLQGRWDAGCHRADRLYADLCAQGYRGSARTLRRFLAPWRSPTTTRPARLPAAILRHPSPRHTVGLFFRALDTLNSDERAYLHHLTHACPVAAILQHLVTTFHALVTAHAVADLPRGSRRRRTAAYRKWLPLSAAPSVIVRPSTAGSLQCGVKDRWRGR